MNNKIFRIFSYIIATGLGLGYSPIAPGTVGSLAVLILLYYLTPVNIIGIIFILLLLFFIGIYCSTLVEIETGKDPSIVIIDEIVGMGISLIVVPKDWRLFLMAFILFRILDIWKPLFINSIQKLKGGWGIMFDDLLAGLYTLFTIHLIKIFFF